MPLVCSFDLPLSLFFVVRQIELHCKITNWGLTGKFVPVADLHGITI
jgi:hypothetical protein